MKPAMANHGTAVTEAMMAEKVDMNLDMTNPPEELVN